ncbi:MAG: ATP-dependent zinc metalloprotease FtsH [Planctomycetes bacterium]|nr:ATP-dependent zinc metalloprotease FtsH [Planctomycetota bacterium]
MSDNQQAPPVKGKGFRSSGIIIFLIITGVVLLLHNLYLQKSTARYKRVQFLEFIEFLKSKKSSDGSLAKKITKEGNVVECEFKSPQIFSDNKEYDGIVTRFPPEYFDGPESFNLIAQLVDDSKNFIYKEEDTFWRDIILPLIPWLLFVLLLMWFLSRQLRAASGSNNVFTFGRSRARFIHPEKVNVKFDDVAGLKEAKDDVKEIVEFLKNPKKFRKLGGKVPKGVLFIGSPGTGKTLLAKAIATEASVPFFSISGSDFVEMFVGVGAARVRDLFKQARERAPSIIFLDEIDAVGRRRGSGLGGGHDEREQTLNQILVEMDGFDTDLHVIVIAATNRPDILDPALLRPGRFDRTIVIDLPDVKGRQEILNVHAKKIKIAPEVNLEVIAKTTPGLSGADLAAIVNEAALNATLKNLELVALECFEEAKDKVMFGRERKSMVIDQNEKKITAYHEAGHALVAELLQPYTDPVHKVSIIPRGMALGLTMTLPDKDRYQVQKKYLLATITRLFGGRVAEELAFDDISAGARDDIEKATELAKNIVCRWGMTEKLGPISYTDSEEHLFLGREIVRTRPHSDEVSRDIDKEVRNIIDQCYNKAKELLSKNKDKLELLANLLLEKEVISGSEIRTILNGHTS